MLVMMLCFGDAQQQHSKTWRDSLPSPDDFKQREDHLPAPPPPLYGSWQPYGRAAKLYPRFIGPRCVVHQGRGRTKQHK